MNASIRFPKGCYKGCLVSDIIIKDPDYVKWAIQIKMISLSKMIKI